MTLLYCKTCLQIISLCKTQAICPCGSCGGNFVSDRDCVYWGNGIPIGFSNSQFRAAIEAQPEHGQGQAFYAFVISKGSKYVKKVEIFEDEQ